ncbi:putative oxidoreductase, short-chain dehydrogenase/reductase [Paraburkholderia xenovorans LB400]|nr:putative oxidoreductase, short-chain dehydrogenase/reductase [Paraburkholderia xenovorans LB400]
MLGLDLSDPASITRFSTQVLKVHEKIDVLMNNAGIMALPKLIKDSRGYELQFSTNHLGHFQLTALLWDALKKPAVRAW